MSESICTKKIMKFEQIRQKLTTTRWKIARPYNFDFKDWEESAEDHANWRSLVKSGASEFEEKRPRHQKRNDPGGFTFKSGSTPSIPCPNCHRLFSGRKSDSLVISAPWWFDTQYTHYILYVFSKFKSINGFLSI